VSRAPVVQVHDAFRLHPVPGGAVAALRGLSLTVHPGERVVVHGPNGSGKTTLLRVLAGEQPLSAGRAVVGGVDVGATGGATSGAAGRELARWRAARLGWVDQHPARTLRPEFDVLDNVALQQRLAGVPAPAARGAARDLLEELGLARLAVRRPGSLSGGEAQRVALAAALAHRPVLLLADEPTGELDADTAREVYDLVARAVGAAGAALVLVSHDARAARVADRVVRIRDGRLGETWEPGGPELQVVDDRGWVRLPEALRPASHAVRAVRVGDGVRLDPAGAGTGPAAAPAAASAARAAAEPVAGPPVARARGVVKAYGDRRVLAGVDLDVAPGRVTVLRGRSGTGKSTLLRVLTGLERPDAGEVELFARPLAGLDRDRLAVLRRGGVAFVGQQLHLAETSDVAANLELALALRGLPAAPGRVTARLAELGLLPVRSRPVRMLSGGERQRVAVARALVGDARLLVLDEPSSSLDEASAEQLAAVLAAAAGRGRAVLVATHDPVLTRTADRVVDLDPAADEGQITAAGAFPRELPAGNEG